MFRKFVCAMVMIVTGFNLKPVIDSEIEITGFDLSSRGAETYIRLSSGEEFILWEGQKVVVKTELPCIVQRRGETGWYKAIVYPQKHIRFVPVKSTESILGYQFRLPSRRSQTRRRTKVLLFSPELRERTYPGRPPIYYLSRVLREHGFEVMAVDVDIVGRKNFIRHVRDFEPTIVAGTALSVQINEAMDLMEMARRQCPKAIMVLGGNHATAAGQYLLPLHAAYLDAVAIGEGLTTIQLIAKAAERGEWESKRGEIPGLLQWDGSNLQYNTPAHAEDPNRFSPDLSYHSSYDFDIFRRDDGTPRRTFQFMTAFGCENACFFCFSSTNKRGEINRVERRMNLSAAENIIRTAAAAGYEAVYFDDDTFTRDREHALELTRLCKKHQLVFGCHTRPDCEDEGLIRGFIANGCRYMFSGFESAVPEILRGANKTDNPLAYQEAYLRSYQLKNEVGIPVSAFMIHGMPRLVKGNRDRSFEPDTLEDSRFSIEFAVRKLDPVYLSMNVLRFLPAVPFSFAPQFQFFRPVAGPLHGGFWDKKWIAEHGVSDPRCFHPILRAFEGSGSAIPIHMTPERCYAILKIAVQTVNQKNAESGRNQTKIVVDQWFEDRYLNQQWVGGTLQYQLAPFEAIV